MASLNCYPKTFAPNIATVIRYLEKTAYLYPDLILTRYMKDSLARSFLWNTASFNENGAPQLKQRELIQRLKTKYYFKILNST